MGYYRVIIEYEWILNMEYGKEWILNMKYGVWVNVEYGNIEYEWMLNMKYGVWVSMVECGLLVLISTD